MSMTYNRPPSPIRRSKRAARMLYECVLKLKLLGDESGDVSGDVGGEEEGDGIDSERGEMR